MTFKRKKKRQKLDINESYLVDIMVKKFDELNENMKTLIVDKIIDLESRLSELETLESEIKVFGGGRGA